MLQLNKRKQPSFLTQLVDIFLIELTNWRWSWRVMLVTGTLAPVFSTIGLGIFARDSGKVALTYVLVGNIVLSIMFNTMDNINTHILFMRFHGMLDYFATLPIRRSILILSILLAFILLSLPSLLITIILGSLILGIPLHVNPLIIVVVPLCAAPLAGFGAIIGSRARTGEEASAIGFIVILVLMGLGPVLIPPNKLPPIFSVLGWLSPATYASSALRQVLIGPLTGKLTIDLGVLFGVSIITFVLASKIVNWRRF